MTRIKFHQRTVLLVACGILAGIALACRSQNPKPVPTSAANTRPTPAANATTATSTEMYQGTAALEAVNKIKEKIGGQVKALDINIAPDFVSIDAQDAKDPK